MFYTKEHLKSMGITTEGQLNQFVDDYRRTHPNCFVCFRDGGVSLGYDFDSQEGHENIGYISKYPEKLSGDFIRGYTKAVQDIQEVFQYIQTDLKFHRKTLTSKLCSQLLACCLKNRERLRESLNGFIRWNTQKKDFEFYEPERKR